jgi:hypothetical protein
MADDYAGNSTTTGAISVGGQASGNIEVANDTDWFRVTLTAGTTYRIDLNGSAGGGGTLSDPYVFIYDSNGNPGGADDNSGVGFDSREFYTANQGTGSYYVSARANGPVTGTYTVHVTQDDHAADLENPAQLGTIDSSGGRLTVSIETSGDHDWYATTLVAGHNYVIRNSGSATGNGSLSDPNVGLRDHHGNLLASDDDGGVHFDSALAVHSDDGGIYYIDAAAFGSSVGSSELSVQDLGTGPATSHFQVPSGLAINAFGTSAAAGGWSSQNATPRFLGDADGNDQTDIFGFGGAGVYIANGHNDVFDNATLALNSFGSAASGGGWTSQDQYPRAIANVDSSSYSDIVGFGAAGVYEALGTGNGTFGAGHLALASFGASAAGGGWSSQDLYPRILGDVNGDHIDDIVGFGSSGTYVALATGGGNFAAAIFNPGMFGSSDVGGGWVSFDKYPRALADVNGDGKADIVGFGGNGVFVALSNGDGHFAAAVQAINSFGASGAGGGWINQTTYPRELADVNHDARADIVAFGANGVYIATGNIDGTFNAATFDLQDFGNSDVAGGWTSQDLYPRLLADFTGDHVPDIVAFGAAGAYVSPDYNFLIV